MQLIVQNSAVCHHKHRLEHLLVFLIMQRCQSVGEPGNRVRLAAACTMLQQPALTLFLRFRVSNQLFYDVQLMVAWEDNLLRFCGHLLAIDQFHFLLYLQTDITLQQSQQHIPAQHLLPQITRWVAVRISRVATITNITSTITTLIEWQEESLFSLQLGGHNHLFQIHTKAGQYTIVELEQRFLGITVVHILVARVLHRLTSELVLQFQCDDRNTVY